MRSGSCVVSEQLGAALLMIEMRVWGVGGVGCDK